MSPALNESSAMRCFECSDAIEIRDGITFDFCTGLPHVLTIRFHNTKTMCHCMGHIIVWVWQVLTRSQSEVVLVCMYVESM